MEMEETDCTTFWMHSTPYVYFPCVFSNLRDPLNTSYSCSVENENRTINFSCDNFRKFSPIFMLYTYRILLFSRIILILPVYKLKMFENSCKKSFFCAVLDQ